MTERDRFEKKMHEMGISISRGLIGYESDLTQQFWEIWQAAIEGKE